MAIPTARASAATSPSGVAARKKREKTKTSFDLSLAQLAEARQRQGLSSFFSGTAVPETMLGIGFDRSRRRRRGAATPGGVAPGATLLGGGYAA